MTNTFKTLNPLGSTNIKDLSDNASNFDEAVNSESPSFVDRFGKRRETIAGMEASFAAFLNASGYEFIGAYESGPLSITRPTQVFSYGGEYWRPGPTLSLPYTTVANWATDSSKFVSIGDASLRQSLLNETDPLQGSALVPTTARVVLNQAAARALPVTGSSTIIMLGHTVSGDGGGGLYSFDESDNTSADNGGTVLVTTGGARLKLKYAGIPDPRIFGMKLDGTTDASNAILRAHAAWGEVQLPAGAIAIKSAMTFDAQTMCIRGAGRGMTRLICSVPSGTVIKHTPTSAAHKFILDGFSMQAANAPAAGQWAIWTDATSQLTTETYNGKRLVGARETHRGSIENITLEPVAGTSATNGFANGIRVTSSMNFSIRSVTAYGKDGYRTGEAFAIDGDGVPVDIRFNDIYGYNYGIGLNCPDYVEAVYIRETEFVNVDQGIVCGLYQSGRSVLASQALCGSSAMRIDPMHANVESIGIYLKNAPFARVAGVNIVLNPKAGTLNAIGVNVESANLCNISDNNVFYAENSNATNVYGVVLNQVTNSKADGNQGQNCQFAVYLADSVGNSVDQGFAFRGNAAYGVGGNAGSTLNFIGQNFNDAGMEYQLGSNDNLIETTDYAASPIITVTAVASFDVAIPVPLGTFRQVPQFAMAIARDGAKLIGSYKQSASNTANLVFSFRNSDGTVMTAGSYAVSLFASLR